MHHANQETAQGKAARVNVVVFRQPMRGMIPRMGMGVQVNLATVMAVNVEVNPFANDPPEDARA
jgi:hypothetical protein